KVKVSEEMFGYFLLKPIIPYLRSASGSPKEGPVNRNKTFIKKLWFIPAFIDIWVGYFFKTNFSFKGYDVIIADRFYTDIWANLLYYGYLPNWAFKLVTILPKTDIALMLAVSPEVVLKREQEFPTDYY